MRLVIISGLSGSGKSVALNVLEDAGFYCIDNIPVGPLRSFVKESQSDQAPDYDQVGVGLDARNLPDIAQLPELIDEFRKAGASCEVVFLQAENDVLLLRFSETRRRHPLTSDVVSLPEAIAKERELLGPIIDMADLIIDTSSTTVNELRDLVRDRVKNRGQDALSILIESFGYKHGLPADADFVFDVRCLPNPYWEPELRPMNGKAKPVRDFLSAQAQVQEMVGDIEGFLNHWIPRYKNFQRSYLTIAIGCTGGQHRSVYIAEALAERLMTAHGPIQTRHHELP
ncbi:MAG: RNase adapter RapZ [Gammaproteobacteria bacterium]|nr:RNase adapter RapZ [Gammaproteobacteria bacterium]